MSRKVTPCLAPEDSKADDFDFCAERIEEPPSCERISRRRRQKWAPQIVDDWPEEVPVYVEELELYELYFGDELDKILGFKK
ncbi:hypothetical protein [Bradyrhizobium sp. dw_78]|uniref:hypothetical protein n=1 Tax=Bradyrhizobium sp. dw_78 TaxID=2719793 RepID=UPI001BD1F8B9|nr:hypothetical protein [Bradyrhizobium sp. dw_78]